MAGVLRGEIYWAELGPPIGHEEGRRRPMLVISNDLFNERSRTAITLAITAEPPTVGYPITWQLPPGFLPRQSCVKVPYVRTFAVERLTDRIARLSEDEVGEIVQALLEIIG